MLDASPVDENLNTNNINNKSVCFDLTNLVITDKKINEQQQNKPMPNKKESILKQKSYDSLTNCDAIDLKIKQTRIDQFNKHKECLPPRKKRKSSISKDQIEI